MKMELERLIKRLTDSGIDDGEAAEEENDSEYEVLYLIKVLLRFLVFWEIVDKSSS